MLTKLLKNQLIVFNALIIVNLVKTSKLIKTQYNDFNYNENVILGKLL